MTDAEQIAMLENERRQMMSIITQVRHALGTPDNMDVTHHARQVVAELQRAREDLVQARAMLEQAHEELQVAQIDAAKWRTVPWSLFEPTTRIAMGDFASWSAYDEAYDLRRWYYANKPQEVRA